MRVTWVFDKRFWFLMKFGWLHERGFLIFELEMGGCKINDFWFLVKSGWVPKKGFKWVLVLIRNKEVLGKGFWFLVELNGCLREDFDY